MIKVSGVVTLKVGYTIELDMTEEEFDTLPKYKQNDEIDSAIDWYNALLDSETDDIEVWDLEEIKGGK